jgi:hypothetical protein
VRAVQINPSDEVAPLDVVPTTRKMPLPYVTALHTLELGRVPDVQVTPSGDVADRVDDAATATNTPLPKVTDAHVDEAGSA